MLFESIDILDETFEYRPRQWVGVKDGCIAYIGNTVPVDAEIYGERYCGVNKLLMPALYNAYYRRQKG